MHSAYRDLVLARVQAAVGAARAVQDVSHRGLRGELREIVLRDLFRPLFPVDVGLGTGQVITADNRSSKQQDVVIYDRRILPPILLEQSVGLFPVESVLYTVEVKSVLTATELKTSHASAAELLTFPYAHGRFTETEEGIAHPFRRAIPALFAFGSDLSSSGKTEVERYDEVRGEQSVAPHVICVVGSGYWYQSRDRRWMRSARRYPFEEVIDFLSGVMNSYRGLAASRGEPHLGNYLMNGAP